MLCRAEHAGGVVEQSAVLGMMEPLGSREVHQPIPCQAEHFPGQLLQVAALECIHRAVDFLHHHLGFFRGAGNQLPPIHLVLFRCRANPFDLQLNPSVKLGDGTPYLDDGAGGEGVCIPAPQLAFHFPALVTELHVQVVVAVFILALLAGTHQQKAFVPHSCLQLCQGQLLHR